MALSAPSTPTSPLPRQLLQYVSSQLVAALIDRPAPTISLPSAPWGRGVDAAAAAQRVRAATASRAAPCPKGRPGAPRQGSGGHVHAVAPAMSTTSSGVVMRGLPTPPGLPAQGSGGSTHHVAPATATKTATAAVVMGGGPAAPSGLPAQGSGENDDAAALAAASLLAVRRPKPPGPPREGSGGSGGVIHAALAAADS